MAKRDIDDIKNFREDISPFLVHLTRNYNGKCASANLENIIIKQRLICGDSEVSSATYPVYNADMNEEDRKAFYSAICFTETPLGEIHSLLDIRGRSVNLEPYGLVFLMKKLQAKGVSPVIYLNNETGKAEQVVKDLATLTNAKTRDTAKFLLPLVSFFGPKFRTPGVSETPEGQHEFLWEREWRYQSTMGDFGFDWDDVFIGLCKHEEISVFEKLAPSIEFIDPRHNKKWYADKLLRARHRSELKNSVV